MRWNLTLEMILLKTKGKALALALAVAATTIITSANIICAL